MNAIVKISTDNSEWDSMGDNPQETLDEAASILGKRLIKAIPGTHYSIVSGASSIQILDFDNGYDEDEREIQGWLNDNFQNALNDAYGGGINFCEICGIELKDDPEEYAISQDGDIYCLECDDTCETDDEGRTL